MAAQQITGPDIWRAVRNDPVMMGALPTPAHQTVMQSYIMNDLPAALADLLDQPASLETLLKSQIAYARSALSTGLTRKIVAFDADGPDDPILDMVDRVLRGMVNTAISILQPFADNVEAMLRLTNTTEREHLEVMNLTLENLERVLRRELTIADILLRQPAVILHHTDQQDLTAQ